MFERGRIDHFGVTDPSVEALHEVRRRLPAEGEGTTDNEVRDFGPLYSLHYVDPASTSRSICSSPTGTRG
jgi:hypothetical protein